MIKTRTKEKIPKGKSYPVGAEVISQALEGVPQYDLLELSFWVQDQYFASDYNKKIKEKGNIVVLDADYSPLFDRWTIRINSVPSEHKKNVSEQIESKALPELKRRLNDKAMLPERFGFKVSFSLQAGEIDIFR